MVLLSLSLYANFHRFTTPDQLLAERYSENFSFSYIFKDDFVEKDSVY